MWFKGQNRNKGECGDCSRFSCSEKLGRKVFSIRAGGLTHQMDPGADFRMPEMQYLFRPLFPHLPFALPTGQSHLDGSFPALLASLAKLDVLILDDWMRDPISAPNAQDLLELLDDHFGCVSTIVASPTPRWAILSSTGSFTMPTAFHCLAILKENYVETGPCRTPDVQYL